MEFESSEQAKEVLKDTKANELLREDAIRYLQKTPHPEVVQLLLSVLDDDDFGVRWAASAALAELGTLALEPILQTLIKRSDNIRVRRGIYHALHYNHSSALPSRIAELMQAIKGPAPDIIVPEVAFQCLQELQQNARIA